MIQILDLLEFHILAAAKGMERYYGFPSGAGDDEESICLAVYQLAKAGVLSREGAELRICPELSALLDAINGADTVMVIDRGGHRVPRQCVYRFPGDLVEDGQERYVCLESSNTDADSVCLSSLDESELFRQLQDLIQLPEELLPGDIGDYDFDGYWDSHMPSGLWEKLDRGILKETKDLLEDAEGSIRAVHSVFTLRDKRDGQIRKRMVLLEFPLEFCMAVQTPDGTKRYRYDMETAFHILKAWWRDEG